MPNTHDIPKHTDFISSHQEVLFWSFDADIIQNHYDTYIYSAPVEVQLFNALKKISASKNKNIRERSFTIFAGDTVSDAPLYGIAIPSGTSSRITDILSSFFENVAGYQCMEYSALPAVPLVPRYRYDNGMVYEYGDSELAGKTNRDKTERYGLKIVYRNSESAEHFGIKEQYS